MFFTAFQIKEKRDPRNSEPALNLILFSKLYNPYMFNFAGAKLEVPTADTRKGLGVLTPPSPCPSPPFCCRLAVVAWQAQGLQVVPIAWIAAVGNFLDVIHDSSRFRSTFAQAFFTKRVCSSIGGAEFSPLRRLIKIMFDRTGSVVLFLGLRPSRFQKLLTWKTRHINLPKIVFSFLHKLDRSFPAASRLFRRRRHNGVRVVCPRLHKE
ncbi:hypothetical protein GCWU000246_00692 [Jonquetella anthropi E3_33 E1]|nr:hypothetical protein GCWU000246_00692 [Jonquetella anthropi E3_33 E1]